MRRKYYLSVGVTQSNDSSCHSRGSSHNGSRKCERIKRHANKRIRQALNLDLKDRVNE